MSSARVNFGEKNGSTIYYILKLLVGPRQNEKELVFCLLV